MVITNVPLCVVARVHYPLTCIVPGAGAWAEVVGVGVGGLVCFCMHFVCVFCTLCEFVL